MKPKSVAMGALLMLVGCLAGVWMTCTTSIAAPLIEPRLDQGPQGIRDGAQDVARFFKMYGFEGGFKLMTAQRDEQLSRRYYRIKLDAELLPELKKQLVTNWTLGRFNRSVYQNGVSGRLKKSSNLPKWWNLSTPPVADHLMLDHGGNANWYIVLVSNGEVCLMWCGN